MGNKYQMTITIEMPLYLQFYIQFVFLKGNNSCDHINNFNQFLEAILEIQPKDYVSLVKEKGVDYFTFELPSLRYKDPLYYNYVSPKNNKILIEAMKIAFETSMFSSMVTSMKFDYIIEKGLIRCHHGERERTMKQFCHYNNIPFHLLDFDYISKRFTRFLQLHKDYVIANKQLSIHFVRTRKEYHERKKTESKQYRISYE